VTIAVGVLSRELPEDARLFLYDDATAHWVVAPHQPKVGPMYGVYRRCLAHCMVGPLVDVPHWDRLRSGNEIVFDPDTAFMPLLAPFWRPAHRDGLDLAEFVIPVP